MHNTTTTQADRVRYPAGPFDRAGEMTDSTRAEAIRDIEQLPARMRATVRALDAAQIDAPYREGGWTVRQLVHHVVDSHVNGSTRLKLALTEDNPTVKPVDENLWAELPDRHVDVEMSLRVPRQEEEAKGSNKRTQRGRHLERVRTHSGGRSPGTSARHTRPATPVVPPDVPSTRHVSAMSPIRGKGRARSDHVRRAPVRRCDVLDGRRCDVLRGAAGARGAHFAAP